jgi:hypothetical protein
MAEVRSTFILRLWTTDDPLLGRPAQGRGRIDHLQSGERLYFDHLDQMLTFIRYHFGAYDTLQPVALVCARCSHQSQQIDTPTSIKEDWT